MKNDEKPTKPAALKSGDWIGLVAPSSPFDRGQLQRGIRFLERHGFRVRHLPELFTREKAFLAGEDDVRAGEIHCMFEDPQVRAIFVARGGYGAQRLLPLLDRDLIRRHPKIFIGYSDATCLLQFLLDVCNLVPIHGPVVVEMGSLDALVGETLLRGLQDPHPCGAIPMEEVCWIRKGRARAPLVGGNLSILCATLGTPWAVKTAGRILFIEDRGEKPYRVDRMLVQMRQAGKLSGIEGLVLGDFLGVDVGGDACADTKAMEEVLRENTRDLGVPVLAGLPVGHGTRNFPIPLGVSAEINGDAVFSILESAVTLR